MTSRVSFPLAICLVAGAIAVVGLFRPGGDRGDATAAAPPQAGSTATATVDIRDFAFGGDLAVEPGAVVEVANADSASHTFTATGGGFATGTISGGGTTTFTAPTEPGTYAVFCAIHPSMTAALTVA